MKPLTKGRAPQLTLKAPPELLQALKRAAAEESARRGRPVPVAEWVRETLEARLHREQRHRLSREEEDAAWIAIADAAEAEPGEDIPLEQVKAKALSTP